MTKVHVVGAGPAGSMAAISALSSGFDVVMSEDHTVAGQPENCSGLFSKDGLESLRRFVNYEKFKINDIYGADIHLLDQRLSVRRESPVGFVCDRAAMDQALAKRAESEGAKVNYGERIKDKFHSDNIIGADGPLSSVANYFSFNKIGQYAATLQALINFRCSDMHAVQVFLSNSLFPGFFAWIIPHDEYTAELGVGVEVPHKVHEAWKTLLKLKGVDSTIKPKGAIIPIGIRPQTGMRIGKRNILLTGDAAGQVKSTTGGGVIFGSNCAILAGKYATAPLRYELEWRARFGADLGLHGIVHRYLASRSDYELAELGRRLKKLNLDVYLSAHGHMDRPTKMLRPTLVAHMIKNLTGVA